MNDEIASKIEQLIEYVNILKGYQHFKRKTETTGVLPEGIFDPWGAGYFAGKFCNTICTLGGIQEQTCSHVRKNRYRKAPLLLAE